MKLVRVVKVWYDEEPKYKQLNSGLVLELEDGRMLRHSQDTPVVPFEEVKDDKDQYLNETNK